MLAYEEVGTGDPPFVFVHGWTCSHDDFAPQVDHFGQRHRVVALDLRGHGASGAPQQPYTVPDFADDVAWLSAQIGVERPVLVGHSMGGAIVLEVAGVIPISHAPSSCSMRRRLRIPFRLPTARWSRSRRRSTDLTARRRVHRVDHAVSGLGRDPQLQARIRRDMAAVPDHVAQSCIAGMGQWDGPAAAGACRVPAVHIAADEPINDAAALRALNPLLRTGQTIGAGHFNHLEVPDQVNAMIERFLSGERVGSQHGAGRLQRERSRPSPPSSSSTSRCARRGPAPGRSGGRCRRTGRGWRRAG